MNIHIDLFNKERTVLGFTYEFLRMCNERDKEGNPIIEEYHAFTIGFLIVNFQISIRA